MENTIIRTIDNEMSPRFGHTITLISRAKDHAKAVLFGGATGSDGHFSINSDTYLYLIEEQKWIKLNRKKNIFYIIIIAKGTIPTPRAAHAACCVNENQLVIYGGATGCKKIKNL